MNICLRNWSLECMCVLILCVIVCERAREAERVRVSVCVSASATHECQRTSKILPPLPKALLRDFRARNLRAVAQQQQVLLQQLNAFYEASCAASATTTTAAPDAPASPATHLLSCQYLYYCTSKASKVSTW